MGETVLGGVERAGAALGTAEGSRSADALRLDEVRRRVGAPRRLEADAWGPGARAAQRARAAVPCRRVRRGNQGGPCVNVVERDGLQCTFCTPDGRRCASRAFLQIHQREAFARGGGDELENLALLCASHNRLLAERDFGIEHVAERRGAAVAAGRRFVQTK